MIIMEMLMEDGKESPETTCEWIRTPASVARCARRHSIDEPAATGYACSVRTIRLSRITAMLDDVAALRGEWKSGVLRGISLSPEFVSRY
jgi:hypothetical protein